MRPRSSGNGASKPTLARMAPSADESFVRWWMARARAAASPGSARDLVVMNSQADVRDVLPAVQAPTLVIHRVGDRDARVEEGRYIAAHVPGARFVELPGDTHVPFWEPDDVVDEVEEFLTGLRPTRVADRVLATILFTDLVGSTERAGALGDHAWAELLERHHQARATRACAIRRRRDRYRRRRVPSAVRRASPGDSLRARDPRRSRRASALTSAPGVHTGEVERPRGGGPRGISVHTGARIAAAGVRRRCSGLGDDARPRRRVGSRVCGPRRSRAEGHRRAPALRCNGLTERASRKSSGDIPARWPTRTLRPHVTSTVVASDPSPR